jgi:hypothetical protein
MASCHDSAVMDLGGDEMFGRGLRYTPHACHADIFCARRVKSGAETTLEG